MSVEIGGEIAKQMLSSLMSMQKELENIKTVQLTQNRPHAWSTFALKNHYAVFFQATEIEANFEGDLFHNKRKRPVIVKSLHVKTIVTSHYPPNPSSGLTKGTIYIRTDRGDYLIPETELTLPTTHVASTVPSSVTYPYDFEIPINLILDADTKLQYGLKLECAAEQVTVTPQIAANIGALITDYEAPRY